MRLFYKNIGDTIPSFISHREVIRPDENHIDDDNVIDANVENYVLNWDGATVTPQRKSQEEIDIVEEKKNKGKIRKIKLSELEAEYSRLVDTALGTKSINKKLMLVAGAVSILRKETKGKTLKKTTDIELLDSLEALADNLRDIEERKELAIAWLEDDVRSLPELQNYDVTTDPAWP